MWVGERGLLSAPAITSIISGDFGAGFDFVEKLAACRGFVIGYRALPVRDLGKKRVPSKLLEYKYEGFINYIQVIFHER